MLVEGSKVIELPELITRKFLLDFKNDDDKFSIAPMQGWEYWIQSFDTDVYFLKENQNEDQRFCHQKGYFAVYSSKESALHDIRYTIKMAKNNN